MRFVTICLLPVLLALSGVSAATAQEPEALACSISVTPSRAEAGDPVAVTWKTVGATHLSVSGLVDLPADAMLSDSVALTAPSESYLFLLVAQNAAGERVTCTDLLSIPVIVQIDEQENIGEPRPCGPGIPDPHCHIDRFPDPHPPVKHYPEGFFPELVPI